MPSITYRISRFGTVLLTPEQQLSAYLILRTKCVLRRAVEYPNKRYIPPQNNWMYWVGLDRDFYVTHDGYARWYQQQWLLWNYPDTNTLNAICQVGNGLYSQIMGELAKKPNIPPLPPSTPPTSSPFSVLGRIQAPAISTMTFYAFNDGDFDVTLDWQTPPSPDGCTPSPVLLSPPGPVSDQLPPPGPNMPSPPPAGALDPPIAPTGSPASGASLIPPGFPSGYQSSPPNTTGRLRLAFSATKVVNGGTCQANVSFVETREIDWSGQTPVAGDFQMVQEPHTRTSCGFPFAPFVLWYKGARFNPIVTTVNLGADERIWPCTSVQRL